MLLVISGVISNVEQKPTGVTFACSQFSLTESKQNFKYKRDRFISVI